MWHFCSKSMSINLQRVQNYAMWIILKKPPRTSSEVCLHLLGWLNLYQHRCISLLWQVHKCILHLAPESLCSKFMTNDQFGYSSTRGKDNIHLVRPKTEYGRNSFSFKGAMLYNNLPLATWQLRSCAVFQCACATYLFWNCN